jgi:hypothetical protein
MGGVKVKLQNITKHFGVNQVNQIKFDWGNNMSKCKSLLIILSILTILSFSGCVDVTSTTKVKVDYDGTVKSYQNTLNISKSTIAMMESMGNAFGENSEEFELEDFNENLRGDYLTEHPNAEIDANAYYDDYGNAIIYIKADELILPENETLNIFNLSDKIIYNHSLVAPNDDEYGELLSGYKIDYYLEMPGEIIDSNADTVDGRVAEWHTNAYELSQNGGYIFAVSKIEKPNYMPYIAGFGIILVGIVGIIFVKRPKSPKTKDGENGELNE